MFGLPYKLIGFGVLGLLLVFWAMFTIGQAKQIGALKTQLDSAIEIANTNATIHDKAMADLAADHKIELDAVKAKARNRQIADARRKEINDAPPTDDGPLAPVLRRTLDGLPGYKAGAPNSPNEGAGNQPDLARTVPGAGITWAWGNTASRGPSD